jgi:hypothetical protein
MIVTTLRLCPQNEHQPRVNNFSASIMEHAQAFWRYQAIVELLATFLGENGHDKIASMC